MRILTYIPIVCLLATSLGAPAPSMDEDMTENIEFKDSRTLLDIMKNKGWSTEGLTTRELGSMTVFQRDGHPVGYCVVESQWKPISPETLPLSDVTRIEYGDPSGPPDGSIWFTIDDPTEIQLWVAAYRNHSRSSHKIVRFVSLTADAGFENASEEVTYGTGHGCHLGLYFYNGDKLILTAGGHWDEASKPGKPSSNQVLQSLVWDRIQRMRVEFERLKPVQKDAVPSKATTPPKQ